jgi:hypothetical protein
MLQSVLSSLRRFAKEGLGLCHAGPRTQTADAMQSPTASCSSVTEAALSKDLGAVGPSRCSVLNWDCRDTCCTGRKTQEGMVWHCATIIAKWQGRFRTHNALPALACFMSAMQGPGGRQSE